MPRLHGEISNNDTIFFIAADENYFHRYAIPLIKSIKASFNYHIHFHLYNPSDFTKSYCKSTGIGYSYEYFDFKAIERAFQFYKIPPFNQEFIRRRSKMIKSLDNMGKLYNELIKTYYACARFIRLYQLISKPTYIIMLDTDSLVRKTFELPSKDFDIHIYEKNDKSHINYTQHLASTVFYTGTEGSYNLLREHAMLILDEFNKDTYYWFLDQETLDVCIQNYRKNPLEKKFVDFDMDLDSYIWCAKGKRKNMEIWIRESLQFHSLP